MADKAANRNLYHFGDATSFFVTPSESRIGLIHQLINARQLHSRAGQHMHSFTSGRTRPRFAAAHSSFNAPSRRAANMPTAPPQSSCTHDIAAVMGATGLRHIHTITPPRRCSRKDDARDCRRHADDGLFRARARRIDISRLTMTGRFISASIARQARDIFLPPTLMAVMPMESSKRAASCRRFRFISPGARHFTSSRGARHAPLIDDDA